MARSDNDSVVLAGFQLASTAHRSIALARYTPAGIDGSFGIGGKSTHDFVTSNAFVTGLAIDGSGRPVVAGYTSP